MLNDNDPFQVPGGTNQDTNQHLAGLLQRAGRTWKSYQEDIDLTTVSGQLINLPLSADQWTVPLVSLSGIFGPGNYLNAYNDSTQYNYACKHNPQVFFTDTNGGNNTTTSNPLSHKYAPLQQLPFDLAWDRVADYNWITPDQFNEMHSGLSGGFDGLTGDAANIRLGDNAVSRLVPMIMSSRAYKDGGVIILWWDESEDDGAPGDNQDDFNHTLGEIVISPLAHENVNGLRPCIPTRDQLFPFLRFAHHAGNSLHVKATGGKSPFLGDAANAADLSGPVQAGSNPDTSVGDFGPDLVHPADSLATTAQRS